MEIYNNLFLQNEDNIIDEFKNEKTTLAELIYLKKIIDKYIDILLEDYYNEVNDDN